MGPLSLEPPAGSMVTQNHAGAAPADSSLAAGFTTSRATPEESGVNWPPLTQLSSA